MRKEEIWAVPLAQAKAFFQQQPDVNDLAQGFRFAGCSITVTELPPRGEGFWCMPQTKITMEGPEEDLNQIYRRFFVQFVSAGG